MEAPRMPKDEAKARLNDADLTIIDVRRKKDEKKIANAIPEDPEQTQSWMDKYAKDKTILLYCS